MFFSVSIPSMNFSFRDWFLSYGMYILTGLAFLIIGLAPFCLGSASRAAQPLFLMGISIFLWFVTTFDFMTTQFLPGTVRVFSLCLTPGIGLHLALFLTQGPRRASRDSLYLLLIYGASILLASFYLLTFAGSVDVWSLALRSAYGYGCLAAFLFLGLLWAALRRSDSDLEKSRLRVVLVGAILGFFLPTLGTVLVSFFHWQVPYNFLIVPSVFFPLSVAYALVQYNLFELDSLFKVGLTRTAVTGLLLLIYALLVYVLSLSVGIYGRDPLVPLFFSLLVVGIFNPILRWVEGVVDRYLYRKEYDPLQLQGEISALLRSPLPPKIVAEKFLDRVSARIGVETAVLIFQKNPEGGYAAVSADGGSMRMRELPADFDFLWLQHFRARSRGIFKGEAESDPALEESRPGLLQVFEELRAEVLVPVLFEEKLQGLICLGKKKSGVGYNGDDFRVLSNLADQFALALKNGSLFEEIDQARERYKILYDRSQALNRQLIDMDRLKRQFVANVSHELRTPISTILGYAEVLLSVGDVAGNRRILERLVTNGRELAELMDSLLDFSQIEAGQATTTLQAVDLPDLLRSMETVVERLIRDRPVKFRSEIDSSLGAAQTDAKKLQQILMHLLTNAVKFTGSGEIALAARPATLGDAGAVEIAVSDTGIGISKEDQGLIFEEFRQLDGSSTRRYGGTGVGLSLCRKLAQSLGGRIDVESVLGKGSTFILTLPLRAFVGESSSGLYSP
jgi:signal transduction histidine kinase